LLCAKGIKLIERNFTCRLGEIDLVMLNANCLIFVEVRYRAYDRFGGGRGSVTPQKQRRLIRSAGIFLSRNPRYADLPCRFDVVSATKKHNGIHYEWIKDAFQL